MNTRRYASRRVKEANAGRKPDPPQAPAARVQVSFNLAVLMDGEVRSSLVQMA